MRTPSFIFFYQPSSQVTKRYSEKQNHRFKAEKKITPKLKIGGSDRGLKLKIGGSDR